MDEHQNPEEATKGGQDHLRAAAGDLKEAADAKVETIHQAVDQKAYQLRGAAQGKAQELTDAAESAWSDAGSQNLCAEAGFPPIFTKNILINRIRIEMPIKATRLVVCHRPEQSAFRGAAMPRQRQIILNHPLSSRVNRDEANLFCEAGRN